MGCHDRPLPSPHSPFQNQTQLQNTLSTYRSSVVSKRQIARLLRRRRGGGFGTFLRLRDRPNRGSRYRPISGPAVQLLASKCVAPSNGSRTLQFIAHPLSWIICDAANHHRTSKAANHTREFLPSQRRKPYCCV